MPFSNVHESLLDRLESLRDQIKKEYELAFEALPDEVKQAHWEKSRKGTPDLWREISLTFYGDSVLFCESLYLARLNLAGAIGVLEKEIDPDLTLVRTKKRAATREQVRLLR